MNLGNSLFHARKKCGLSQEEVAEKLGVSRQTISKWETNETVPDIYQSKKMAKLYHIALDDLIEFDVELSEIQEIIEKTDEKIEERIDWTSAWGKKYPVLLQYQQEVNGNNGRAKGREHGMIGGVCDLVHHDPVIQAHG